MVLKKKEFAENCSLVCDKICYICHLLRISYTYKTCSCRTVHYFGTLFWYDITKFWDENLSLFTFLTGKLRKIMFWTDQKFINLNIITNFCPKIMSENMVHTTWKGYIVPKLKSFYFFDFRVNKNRKSRFRLSRR